MPVSKFVKGAVLPRVGDLSDNFLTELEKVSFTLLPIITVDYESQVSTACLIPIATTLKDANHDVVPITDVHLALDDPKLVPDEDTSYVNPSGVIATYESRVSFEPVPVAAIAIKEVRLSCRARALDDNDGSWTFALRSGGTNYFRDGATVLAFADRFWNQPGYKTVTWKFPTDPDTGLDWTLAAANLIEGAIISHPDAKGNASGGIRFTQIYMEVDYTVQGDRGQYAPVTVNSRAEGVFEPKLSNIGDTDINLMSDSNAIQGSTLDFTLIDTDRFFSNLVANQRNLRGSVVECRWISPNVPRADWFTTFKGELVDWKQESGGNAWKLTAKTVDQAFEGSAGRQKIPEQDFPNAPDPKIFDNFAPHIWGIHNSTGLTDDGMISLFRVSDLEFISSFGRIKDHTRVFTFESGDPPTIVELTETTDWVEDYPIINGRQWSRVTLVGGGAAANADKELRAEVEGYEEFGDGTGLTLVNPALQFLHFLVNFLFNDFQSGLWLSTALAPVDLESFTIARDYFNQTGQSASRYLGGEGSKNNGKQEAQRWLKSLEAKAWWGHDGNLNIGINDPHTLEIYPVGGLIVEGLDDIDEAAYIEEGKNIKNRIAIQYIHQNSTKKFLAGLEVEDLDIENGSDDNIQAFWLPSNLTGAV